MEPTQVLDSSTDSDCVPEYDFVPDHKEYRIRLYETNEKCSYLSYHLKKGKKLPYKREIHGRHIYLAKILIGIIVYYTIFSAILLRFQSLWLKYC